MSDTNSLILFDQLATELIFEIFEYLSNNDIIYTFFYFNQRFNSILLQHQQFLNNLESPKTNFYYWENIFSIIGSQIQCLTITTIDLYFSLDLFPNLKSLIIDSSLEMDHDRLYSIYTSKQFNKLNLFKIKSTIYYEKFQQILFENIYNSKNSLETFECLSNLSSYYFVYINKLKINQNIHSLSLRLNDLDNVGYLLKRTPNLKDLNLFVVTEALYEDKFMLKPIDLSEIKLEKFHFTAEINRLTITNYEQYFLPLIRIIKRFSSTLIYLSINISQVCIEETDIFQLNGFTLQKELLESMIQLKKFHFYARLYQKPINLDYLLSTFENQFWFDHNWSIGIHGKYLKYLYTLPFHFNELDDLIDFDHIKSNNSIILNSSWIWYRVTSIHLSQTYELNLNFIKQLKLKMPNLITIKLNSSPDHSFYAMEESNIIDDEMNLTLDSVTTVYFNGDYMKDIQPWLTYISPNLKNLILSYNSQFDPIVNERIERLKIINATFIDEWMRTIDIYFPNLKHIEIHLRGFYMSNNFIRILKSFKTLKTLMLYCHETRSSSDSTKINLCDKLDKLDLIEILEKYEIKHSYYCYQFVRKTDD